MAIGLSGVQFGLYSRGSLFDILWPKGWALIWGRTIIKTWALIWGNLVCNIPQVMQFCLSDILVHWLTLKYKYHKWSYDCWVSVVRLMKHGLKMLLHIEQKRKFNCLLCKNSLVWMVSSVLTTSTCTKRNKRFYWLRNSQ